MHLTRHWSMKIQRERPYWLLFRLYHFEPFCYRPHPPLGPRSFQLFQALACDHTLHGGDAAIISRLRSSIVLRRIGARTQATSPITDQDRRRDREKSPTQLVVGHTPQMNSSLLHLSQVRLHLSTSHLLVEAMWRYWLGSQKKNVFFQALPKLPPPLTPIWASWSTFWRSKTKRTMRKWKGASIKNY